MNIHEWNFQKWCQVAAGKIRFGPDRRAVESELMDHLQDIFEANTAKGMAPDEAEQKALEAMGSAEELAPQLAAIHKPFWGYALRTCQVLLVVLLVLCLIPLWKYAANLNLHDAPSFPSFAVFDRASYGGDTGRTLYHLSQPNVSISTEAGKFTVTDAAVYTVTKEDGTPTGRRLYLQIKQVSPLPWDEQNKYALFFLNDVMYYFFLRDSLGNEYPCYADNYNGQGGAFYSIGEQSGVFSYTRRCWVSDLPADAQWVEICYDRDGHSYKMRIHLTGGAEP